jgi:tetratricopeptide (TPR) repeat protein
MQVLDRHDEAITQYRKAATMGPPRASRHANLGMALQEIGRLDEASLAFEKAIELAPKTGPFYRNLADCKRFAVVDPRLEAMEELARDKLSLSQQDSRQLLFALGKAFADVGDYDRSFGYVIEGNAIKRRHIVYDEPERLREFARIQAVFTREMMVGRRHAGHGDIQPPVQPVLDAPVGADDFIAALRG